MQFFLKPAHSDSHCENRYMIYLIDMPYLQLTVTDHQSHTPQTHSTKPPVEAHSQQVVSSSVPKSALPRMVSPVANTTTTTANQTLVLALYYSVRL